MIEVLLKIKRKMIFSTKCMGIINYQYGKNEIEILLFTQHKNQFLEEYRSKYERQHFKLLEEYIWDYLYELGLGRIFKEDIKANH